MAGPRGPSRDAEFAIANEAWAAARSITAAEAREGTVGTRAGDRERFRDKLARRHRAVNFSVRAKLTLCGHLKFAPLSILGLFTPGLSNKPDFGLFPEPVGVALVQGRDNLRADRRLDIRFKAAVKAKSHGR
jgi:hypothetical protein